MTIRPLLTVFTLVSLTIDSQALRGASFTGLSDLDGGAFTSQAFGVSSDGSVVVGYGVSGSGTEAFRWTKSTGMVGLGDFDGGSFNSQARGVSSDGSVVAGFGNEGSSFISNGFRWTQASGLVGLGDLPGGSEYSQAYGISSDGSVIVGKSTAASGFHAFRWTQASNQLSDLGTLSNNNFGSWANGVSGDGLAVVGGSNSSPGNQAYRWTAGSGMVGLGDLTGGDFESEAWGASTNGSVVVGQSTSANGINEAFRWTQATGMVGLGDLDGGIFSSVARAVSGDGSIVIGYGTPVSRHIAFIWDATNHMRNLQDVLTNEYGLGPSLAGWQLNEASTISEDGKFLAGYGTDPAGNTEAWVVNLAASTSIPGDYNLNGVVDAADYTIWRDTLGSTTDLRANGDDTGGSASVIDQADYAFWQSHFGNSGSGSKAITAVPEPGTLLMLLLGTLPIGFRRRAKVS